MKALATIAVTFFCFNTIAQQPELILPLGHAEEIYNAEFSLNKKFLLTLSPESGVNIWEVATGRLMNSILPENGQIIVAHFSPDGSYLATGGTDSLLRLWETKNSRLIWTAKNRSRIRDLHFSPDGKKIGLVCHFAPLVVWEHDSVLVGA